MHAQKKGQIKSRSSAVLLHEWAITTDTLLYAGPDQTRPLSSYTLLYLPLSAGVRPTSRWTFILQHKSANTRSLQASGTGFRCEMVWHGPGLHLQRSHAGGTPFILNQEAPVTIEKWPPHSASRAMAWRSAGRFLLASAA